VGSHSLHDDADKLAHCGVELFEIPGAGHDLPFVQGCAAWLACRLISEPHNQQTYLFITEVVGSWVDTRVFRDGHWEFENADASLRSIHYVAGGQFYAIGDGGTCAGR
jgi:flavin reductase (DIM6/NTAB) family NADH-FMN oxidoreductase RutF